MQIPGPKARNETILLFIHPTEVLIMSQLTPDADLATPPVHHRDTCARMSRCLGYLKQSKLGEAHARDPRESTRVSKCARSDIGIHAARRIPNDCSFGEPALFLFASPLNGSI